MIGVARDGDDETADEAPLRPRPVDPCVPIEYPGKPSARSAPSNQGTGFRDSDYSTGQPLGYSEYARVSAVPSMVGEYSECSCVLGVLRVLTGTRRSPCSTRRRCGASTSASSAKPASCAGGGGRYGEQVMGVSTRSTPEYAIVPLEYHEAIVGHAGPARR